MSTLVSHTVAAAASAHPSSSPIRTALPRAPRALVALLLAASVAALAVVADQLVTTWADGHLFAAWLGMWAVVFAGSLLLAAPARRVATQVMRLLNAWARLRAEARANSRFMHLAQTDARVMGDLRAAYDRAELEAESIAQPATHNAASTQAVSASDEWQAGTAETVHLQHGRRYTLYYI